METAPFEVEIDDGVEQRSGVSCEGWRGPMPALLMRNVDAPEGGIGFSTSRSISLQRPRCAEIATARPHRAYFLSRPRPASSFKLTDDDKSVPRCAKAHHFQAGGRGCRP